MFIAPHSPKISETLITMLTLSTVFTIAKTMQPPPCWNLWHSLERKVKAPNENVRGRTQLRGMWDDVVQKLIAGSENQ